jgi:hypothetical protein
VATTLAGLTKDGMASKGLLRHSNLATTTRHYVKAVPENTLSAMNLLESLFNERITYSPVPIPAESVPPGRATHESPATAV